MYMLGVVGETHAHGYFEVISRVFLRGSPVFLPP